jgi:hypothetical protein
MIQELQPPNLTPQALSTYSQIFREFIEKGRSLTYENLFGQDFVTHPSSPKEFFTSEQLIGPSAKNLYPKWLDELCIVCNPKNEITEWIITGPIGGGKTTVAAHAIAYKLYYLSCLVNPQEYYGLMPGHNIVIGLYNIFKYKVRSTSYHILEEIVTRSPYFQKIFKRNPKHTTTLEFPNNIGVMTGSNDLQILGENLFMLLLDEANFMKRGNDPEESQAYKVYAAAIRRMESRFLGPRRLRPWLLILVSSKKHESDFTAKRIQESSGKKNVHVSDYPLWELKPPGTFSGKTFVVQIGDTLRPSRILKEKEELFPGLKNINIPIEFYEAFEANVDGGLNDIAGIASSSSQPLISHKETIGMCIDRTRKHPFWQIQIPSNFMEPDPLEDYLDITSLTRIANSRRVPKVNPHVARFIHVDIGLTGDALGICMGHPTGIKTVTRLSSDGMPYKSEDTIVYIDFMLRIIPNGEIDLAQVRILILFLRDSLGFPIQCVTYDGFQSRESIQLLKKCNIETELLSVDRGVEPYSILQRTILENRISFYDYPPFLKELTNLILDKEKGKVDHPKCNPDGSKGSKDVCDAVASVVYQCLKCSNDFAVLNPRDFLEQENKEDKAMPVPVVTASHSSRTQHEDISWVIGDSSPELQRAVKRTIFK